MPDGDQVTSEGTMNSFMVLHHSTNCEWNKKWLPRFLTNHPEIEYNFNTLLYFTFTEITIRKMAYVMRIKII